MIPTGVSLLIFAQIPITELGLLPLFQNAFMLYICFFPKVLEASLVILFYSMASYLFFPASLIFFMLMNTWFPVLVGTMVMYCQLNSVFKFEMRLPMQNQTSGAEPKDYTN